jgi:CP family cyanate transporter-like MFS transporter
LASDETESAAHAVDRGWLGLALCWFVGINLRTTLLAVPPVLPLIQRDLHLSYTSIGLLSAIPVISMGLLALPAAALAGRLGGRVTVAGGLLLVAAGAALRVAPLGTISLFAFTVALSVGVTIAQTTLPMLMRQWFPTRIGLASAVYTNGLIMGETVAVVVTGPVLLYLLGRDAWAATFIAWSVPVVVALALWLWLAPPAPPLGFARAPVKQPPASPPAPHVVARPRVRGWRLGMLMGSGSLIYFGMNAWIPSFNLAVGRAASTPAALAALNAAQLPVSLGLTLVAQRVAGRRWPFVLAGGACAGQRGWMDLGACHHRAALGRHARRGLGGGVHSGRRATTDAGRA